jgi:hypothetical protein
VTDRGADTDLNSAISLHPGRRQITIPQKRRPVGIRHP